MPAYSPPEQGMLRLDSRTASLSEPPLVVDLDGTLINTDSLFEGAALVLARNPLLPVLFPWWLRRGKAALKREIADRAQLDVELLPYNEPLLDYLRGERQRRSLLLCTGADDRVASAVATHLGLFDAVIASSDAVNMSASTKAARGDTK